jgi:hypothetical protein
MPGSSPGMTHANFPKVVDYGIGTSPTSFGTL